MIKYVNPIPMLDAGKDFVMEFRCVFDGIIEVKEAKLQLIDFLKSATTEELLGFIRCKKIEPVYPDNLKKE